MATALVAAVIALVVGHTVPDLARLRRFGWLHGWIDACARWFGGQAFWRGSFGAALLLGVPVVLLLLVQQALAGTLWGLASLALSVLVLFYCWGPRDLDLDVDAVAAAPDPERRLTALQALAPDPPEPPLTFNGTALVDAVFRAALSRWFGVLFWFVALGPVGALLYRLTQLLARQRAYREQVPAGQAEALEKLAQVLDWLPAQLMTLALAVAADFDAVAAAWRDFHAARNKTLTLDLGFLMAAARASVDADIDVGDSYDDARGPIAEMQEAMALVWRILIVWGVVFALFVLAGRIG
jgi:AmpE protein